MRYQHLPESHSVRSLTSKIVNGFRTVGLIRRSPIIQLVFGVIIGFSLSSFRLRLEESVHDVADKILTVVKTHDDTRPIPDFYLRCVVIIERRAPKPIASARVLHNGWTKKCNETIFYTNSPNVARTVKDQNVVLIHSDFSHFHWQFYKAVVDHAARSPVSWTLIGDELLYVMVENLRASLADMDPAKPIVVGRVMESSSIFATFFPMINSRSISVEAGIVFSGAAIDPVIRRALFTCAQSMNVQLVDPVDEDGSHLFHESNMKSMIGRTYPDQHGGHGQRSCCSEHAATFGGTGFREQRVVEYASYQVRAFGNEGVSEFVPTTTEKPTTTAPPQKVEPTNKPEETKLEPAKNVTIKI